MPYCSYYSHFTKEKVVYKSWEIIKVYCQEGPNFMLRKLWAYVCSWSASYAASNNPPGLETSVIGSENVTGTRAVQDLRIPVELGGSEIISSLCHPVLVQNWELYVSLTLGWLHFLILLIGHWENEIKKYGRGEGLMRIYSWNRLLQLL